MASTTTATTTATQPDTLTLSECLSAAFGINVFAKQRPRVLLPADVFFDEQVRSALGILHNEKQQHEESSSTECSSTSSLWGDEDVFVEEFEPAPPAKQSTPRRRKNKRSPSASTGSTSISKGKEHFYYSLGDYYNKSRRNRRAMEVLRNTGNRECVVLTLMGTKGQNQDCAMVVQPLLKATHKEEHSVLLGVLDGHGGLGHYVAEHCRRRLEKRFTKDLTSMAQSSNQRYTFPDPQAVVDRLTHIVEQVDVSIPKDIADEGGTTASLVVQLDHQTVYMLNTGDSQSFVCAYIAATDECLILESTDRHSPQLDRTERTRLFAAGAQVSDDGYVMYERAVDGVQYALAMSRSLGDRSAPGVIATPQVKALNIGSLKRRALQQCRITTASADLLLKPQDVSLMALSVSDGVLDVGTASLPQIALSLCRSFFLEEEQHPLVAAEQWINLCAKWWQDDYQGQYRDDITLAAAKLF